MMFVFLPILTHAEIKSELKTGSKGGEVLELQKFLINKGFLSGEATGNYFSLTRKAVISYQVSNGIKGTGLVGSVTRSRINRELGKSVILNINTYSNQTSINNTVQENLNIQAKILEFQNKVNANISQNNSIKNTNNQSTISGLSINNGNNIQIEDLKINEGLSTTTLEWRTSIPTESKVFLRDNGGLKVFNSMSGLSSSHFVEMGLTEGLSYSYEIEAIYQGKSSKYQGSFSMLRKIPSSIALLREGNYGDSIPGGGCYETRYLIEVKDQFGNDMENELVSFLNPDNGQLEIQRTFKTRDDQGYIKKHALFSYRQFDFNQTKNLEFSANNGSLKVSEPLIIKGSIIDMFGESSFAKKTSTEWMILSSGRSINPVTGVCR